MIDPVDLKIIQCLLKNSRAQWKEIGEEIHLTGQAVAARVRRLTEERIIEGYTILVNHARIGRPLLAFITVLMSSNRHSEFQRFVEGKEEILEAYKISGDGCYYVSACFSNQEALNRVLDEILQFGNYRLYLSIARIK